MTWHLTTRHSDLSLYLAVKVEAWGMALAPGGGWVLDGGVKTVFSKAGNVGGALLVLVAGWMATVVSGRAEERLADKAELYTGKEYQNAFANPVDDPALPRVLLIGDSISIGYTVPVRKLLAGKANVHRIPTNGQTAEYGAANLEKWLGEGKWDVIHFNWGLWDLCYRNPESKTQGHRDKEHGTITAEPEVYRANLERCVALLKKSGAALIWCETTPVPEGEAGRVVGDDLR